MEWTQMVTVVITAILTAVTAGLVAYIKRIVTGLKNTFVTLQESQRAMIRDILVQKHDYFVEKGSISKFYLSSVESLYKNYKALGGNSFVESLMEEIREIPIK